MSRPIVLTGATAGATGGPPIAAMDPWGYPSVSVQCSATGTISFDVQVSNDDPNSPTNPVSLTAMTWSSTGAVGATASALVSLPFVPLYVRVLVNSGTGSVRATIVQAGPAPA